MKGILMNTEMVKAILDGHKTVTRRLIKPVALGITYEDGSPARKSPYQPGDVLYVRETWCKFVAEHIIDGVWYEYKANATPALEATRKAYGYKWRPSIHMPKEAARIFLRVIGVRVERLQEMTWRDARAEGCQGKFIGCGECAGAGWEILPEDEFADLWDSTIKKSDFDKYGWDANPWVFVISFERVLKDEAMQ